MGGAGDPLGRRERQPLLGWAVVPDVDGDEMTDPVTVLGGGQVASDAREERGGECCDLRTGAAERRVRAPRLGLEDVGARWVGPEFVEKCGEFAATAAGELDLTGNVSRGPRVASGCDRGKPVASGVADDQRHDVDVLRMQASDSLEHTGLLFDRP